MERSQDALIKHEASGPPGTCLDRATNGTSGDPAGAAHKPAIVLDNVEKSYGEVEAVRGISLAVAPGEFVAFMGPSGCGKTTTLRLIAGLEKPTSGDIYIEGQRVNDKKPWKRDTPMVWQTFALFPFLTVAKNVEFGLKMRKVKKSQRAEMVERALQVVRIAHLADRSVHQLSGGEMQRVGVARALVTEPSVLLLDEPLASLDPHLRVRMQSELRGLQRRLGITFIYVTHSQSEAMSMADRIVVMGGGRIQQIGTPREIFRQPSTRYVAEFVGGSTVFGGEVAEVAGDRVTIRSTLGTFTVPAGAEPPEAGVQAEFALHADQVTLEPGDDAIARGSVNRVTGTLFGVEFVGSTVQFLIELQDGTELQIHTGEKDSREFAVDLGDRVSASWAATAAYLLPGKSN
jgi:spermidine/putrescine transport system ATP-binding protein